MKNLFQRLKIVFTLLFADLAFLRKAKIHYHRYEATKQARADHRAGIGFGGPSVRVSMMPFPFSGDMTSIFDTPAGGFPGMEEGAFTSIHRNTPQLNEIEYKDFGGDVAAKMPEILKLVQNNTNGDLDIALNWLTQLIGGDEIQAQANVLLLSLLHDSHDTYKCKKQDYKLEYVDSFPGVKHVHCTINCNGEEVVFMCQNFKPEDITANKHRLTAAKQFYHAMKQRFPSINFVKWEQPVKA